MSNLPGSYIVKNIFILFIIFILLFIMSSYLNDSNLQGLKLLFIQCLNVLYIYVLCICKFHYHLAFSVSKILVLSGSLYITEGLWFPFHFGNFEYFFFALFFNFIIMWIWVDFFFFSVLFGPLRAFYSERFYYLLLLEYLSSLFKYFCFPFLYLILFGILLFGCQYFCFYPPYFLAFKFFSGYIFSLFF